LKVLQTEGMDAVSMRRVAAELGTGPASLYAHVANKDELLELLYDELLVSIPTVEPDAARWREQSIELWTASRDALARGGDIARFSLGRVPMGPNALRIAESFMAILRSGGNTASRNWAGPRPDRHTMAMLATRLSNEAAPIISLNSC